MPSSATRSALLASGISAEKVHVLRNGFRLEEWAARPPRGLNQPFRIGMIGEISPRKGSDRLEGFLKELAGEPDFEVLVVGEGLSDPDFAEKIRERLASNKVKFLGRISPMKDFYREMDLLFVPSRQDPLPTVIVEAGLSAVPVLGARVGGIPEMIENGQNGFLFDNEAEAAEGFQQP